MTSTDPGLTNVQTAVLRAIRSMPLGYRPQDVADELQLIGFTALAQTSVSDRCRCRYSLVGGLPTCLNCGGAL